MYDVVVVGGGTAGVAAAYTAGVLGLKTLLIEKKIHLGGTISSGLVVPMMSAGESKLNRDFYTCLKQKMAQYGCQITFQKNEGWFNPEILKIVLDDMLSEANVEIRFCTQINSLELDVYNRIKSIQVEPGLLSECINKTYSDNTQREKLAGNNILSEYDDAICGDNLYKEERILSERIETRYVIDATGNCDVGKICGCNFLANFEDETQPTTLRFIMSGVNNQKFAEFLREIDPNEEVSPIEVVDRIAHFSTAYTWDEATNWALRPLFKRAVEAGVLTENDSNYFQIFTVAGCNGSVAFNCPRILKKLDLTSSKALSEALIEARKSIFRLTNFCKEYLPGFEKAYISNIADDLGIRISRRIKGKYIYTEEDLKSGKTFANPVLDANYPIDVHSSQKDSSTLEKVGYYQLPIESLMSADVENLFVVGRCLSADFKAQAALRVQQSCFSMGEGVAKYINALVDRN